MVGVDGGWDVSGKKVTLPCDADPPVRGLYALPCFFSPLPFLVSFLFLKIYCFILNINLSGNSTRSSPSTPSRLVAMLRRRTGKDEVPSSNKASDTKPEQEQPHAEVIDTKVTQLVIKPRSKRRNGFIFMLGGIFGIFIALFFANQHEVISLDSLMDLNLESWIEAIPQGIVSDVREFSVRAFQWIAFISIWLPSG
jgi:hypothetical protein